MNCKYAKEDSYGMGYHLCFNPHYKNPTVCPYDKKEQCEILQSNGE